MRGNKLQGTLPRQIGRCTDLTLLDLLGNRLHGPLPPEIGLMKSLSICLFGSQSFDCPIPDVVPACDRPSLVRNCNNTFLEQRAARAKAADSLRLDADKQLAENRRKQGLAALDSGRLSNKALDFDLHLNDPNYSLDEKKALLNAKKQALEQQLELVQKMINNLNRL